MALLRASGQHVGESFALGDVLSGDAAAIVASFNAVVKLADGSGIPLETQKSKLTSDIREQLGLERLNNDKGVR